MNPTKPTMQTMQSPDFTDEENIAIREVEESLRDIGRRTECLWDYVRFLEDKAAKRGDKP